MKPLLVLALLLSACGPMDPAQVEEAALIVWEKYGAHGAPLPKIGVWHQRCIYHRQDGACVDGIFDGQTGEILVGNAPSWADSSLAHELYHADEFRRWRDADVDHLGRGWKWYVPDAEDLLLDAKL